MKHPCQGKVRISRENFSQFAYKSIICTQRAIFIKWFAVPINRDQLRANSLRFRFWKILINKQQNPSKIKLQMIWEFLRKGLDWFLIAVQMAGRMSIIFICIYLEADKWNGRQVKSPIPCPSPKGKGIRFKRFAYNFIIHYSLFDIHH